MMKRYYRSLNETEMRVFGPRLQARKELIKQLNIIEADLFELGSLLEPNLWKEGSEKVHLDISCDPPAFFVEEEAGSEEGNPKP